MKLLGIRGIWDYLRACTMTQPMVNVLTQYTTDEIAYLLLMYNKVIDKRTSPQIALYMTIEDCAKNEYCPYQDASLIDPTLHTSYIRQANEDVLGKYIYDSPDTISKSHAHDSRIEKEFASVVESVRKAQKHIRELLADTLKKSHKDIVK